MRTFERTHPWITFNHDLSQLPYRVWLMLGDITAKVAYIKRTPVSPEFGDQLRLIQLAKGVHATTAIEGNTLTEKQVQAILEDRLQLPPSQAYQQQQIENIEAAFNLIGERILQGDVRPFSHELFREYHALILKDLPLDEGIVPGSYRTYPVSVAAYRGAPPEDCEYLMARLSEWLNQELPAPAGYQAALDVLRALIAHLYIAWIHPFGDGNGRVARLVEFKILLQSGYPDIAAHLLSNHYNLTRDEYYRQLDRSSRVEPVGNIVPFIEYALQGLVDGLNEQISTIHNAQYTVHWRDYIHRHFEGSTGSADQRRKQLLLDLFKEVGAMPVDETRLRELTPRIAREYAGLSTRTFQRDIDALQEEGLLIVENRSVRANLDLLRAFLARQVSRSQPGRKD